MNRKYTGTLHWIYGEQRWSEQRGDYWTNGFHDELIRFTAESNRAAYQLAMKIARQKINESHLPGRPKLNEISVILQALEHENGELDLSTRETTLVRPVFD